MKHYLDAAMQAARKAGDLLRTHFHQPRHVNAKEKHDIKLEIDVQSQELITHALLKNFPNHALYGEEGIVGDQTSDFNGWSIRSTAPSIISTASRIFAFRSRCAARAKLLSA